jgi:hypothetical protein
MLVCPSSRCRSSATLRGMVMTSGPVLVRMREVSSPRVTSRTWSRHSTGDGRRFGSRSAPQTLSGSGRFVAVVPVVNFRSACIASMWSQFKAYQRSTSSGKSCFYTLYGTFHAGL